MTTLESDIPITPKTRGAKCERYTRVSIETLRYILAECTLSDDVREGLKAMLEDAQEALK